MVLSHCETSSSSNKRAPIASIASDDEPDDGHSVSTSSRVGTRSTTQGSQCMAPPAVVTVPAKTVSSGVAAPVGQPPAVVTSASSDAQPPAVITAPVRDDANEAAVVSHHTETTTNASNGATALAAGALIDARKAQLERQHAAESAIMTPSNNQESMRREAVAVAKAAAAAKAGQVNGRIKQTARKSTGTPAPCQQQIAFAAT